MTYGQFDTTEEHQVEETQDAAAAIEELLEVIDRQQHEIRKLQRKIKE